MCSYDPKIAAQVWERVQSPPTAAEDTHFLTAMISEIQADAAAFRQLSGKVSSSQATLLRQLIQQEQSQLHCLKGMYTLITGEKAPTVPPAAAKDPPQITLRRCYGRMLRRLGQYETRRNDVQYGHVYRILARDTQSHCHALLQLLGAIAG